MFRGIFKSLFGEPAPAAQPRPPSPPRRASQIPTTSAHTTVQKQEQLLEKKIAHLELQRDQLTREATEKAASGNKTRALYLLKQKGLIEDQIKSSQGMLNILLQQRMALETAELQRSTFHAVESTNFIMKQNEAALNADKADDILSEMNDQIQNVREVTDLLTQPLPGQEDINEAAEQELAAIMAGGAPAPQPAFALPAVPTSVPVVAASSVDADLAALSAETRVAVPS
jgi:hypothetical protein